MNELTLYTVPDKNPEINIWMAFPAMASFGMSSLGYMSIVKTLDMRSDYFVEKIFTDTKSPRLMTSQVDVMGFSVSFEIDFLGIFDILEKRSIPLKAKDRTEDHPIVFGGGPVLTANPEPYCEFFDFIIIGDAENIDTSIIDVIKANKHLPKSEVLKMVADIKGIYVPSLTEYDETNGVTKKGGELLSIEKFSAPLSKCISTPVLSEKSFFANTFVIEIVRGCPQRCGFCLASYLNLPARFCDYDQIIAGIDFGLKYTNKIALLGALITAHPRFDDICRHILKRKEDIPDLELSVSSLRADSISPVIIQTLVACGQKHSTIAIEAGSERLRKLINKNLSEKQIFETVKTAYENGLKGLKIYAMIGHPTETKHDIDEMIALAKKLKTSFKDFDFTFSFATFVPKSHTPFQFCERESVKSLEQKYEYLKKEFHKLGVKIRTSSVKWDYWQALISRGDRRLCDYLVAVYKDGANLGAFKQTYKNMYKQKLLPPSEEFALRKRDINENLPWDFIKMPPSKEALIKEYQRLLGECNKV